MPDGPDLPCVSRRSLPLQSNDSRLKGFPPLQFAVETLEFVRTAPLILQYPADVAVPRRQLRFRCNRDITKALDGNLGYPHGLRRMNFHK
ncbi:hypothetical protein [Sphingopyxis bauzanensis]|uniref:hypothetical protein n=1 Tax=Sphingopyxis bauzanensis TaxID=651663 RepID=UPI001181A419|nr:hypothetical protein [Sphingopyxis bauzanensis]GGJ40813.1 hypothetical protein GCM10011393_08740 [Sphingopyxis bauzanensis]